ncbi:MAG: hypothetical protein B7Y08_18440 [Rhodospirillales bacterium 24-66-33]|nr:MAG: hypothetical protein B7Y08_18440 [Rhodospirillales bacterium 24-66-33]
MGIDYEGVPPSVDATRSPFGASVYCGSVREGHEFRPDIDQQQQDQINLRQMRLVMNTGEGW